MGEDRLDIEDKGHPRRDNVSTEAKLDGYQKAARISTTPKTSIRSVPYSLSFDGKFLAITRY